jgi:hypothetical protein
MSRRTISLLGWIFVPIGIVFACISSYWLARFLFSSTFTFWKSLGAPSTGTAVIINADRNDIWVEANSGQLFTTTLRCSEKELCKKWVEVKSVSETNIERFTSLKQGNSCEELDAEELPRNPDGIMTDCVLAIYPGPEYEFKTYYAVMSDGSIKYWRHEGSGYGSFFFFIISNIVLSSIVILVLFKIRKKVVADENAG